MRETAALKVEAAVHKIQVVVRKVERLRARLSDAGGAEPRAGRESSARVFPACFLPLALGEPAV